MQHIQRTMTEKLAVSILAREGLTAIWKLHEAAADAHRAGHPRSAAAIVEIAEAAEEAWLGATGGRLTELIASLWTDEYQSRS